MKLSLSLVKSLAKLRNQDEKLVSLISGRIGEVESAEDTSKYYDGVVVGKIVQAKPHPNADKLGLYKVNVGPKTVQVVAGDKTLKVGDLVAYLAPGCFVPSSVKAGEPFKIEKRQLRGETSEGMLGSKAELAISSDHEKVMVIDQPAKTGDKLDKVLELSDLVVEIENKTLTHRPDCFGMMGLAREVSAIVGKPFKSPDWLVELDSTIIKTSSPQIKIINQIKADCPTYLSISMEEVVVGPSPIWLEALLTRLGVRPVNNVVDVTNYLMLVTGQPLHAFDYDKIEGKKIVIRYAKKGEELTLIDGSKLKPHDKAILICDDKKPIAIGGVMGGADSEVTNKTKRILIESANFNMDSIRATSMKHGLLSEAVTRFSRGPSPQLPLPVIGQAAKMLADIAKAKQISPVVGYTTRHQDKTVVADVDDINGLLGANLSSARIKEILRHNEFDVKATGGKLSVKPAYWRRDINIWQDIAEEVGRVNGFDMIERTIPKAPIAPAPVNLVWETKQGLSSSLASLGANQLITYSGLSLDAVKALSWDSKKLFKIVNSRSPGFEYMRPSLLPSLLERVHSNHKLRHREFALFEMGVTHSKLLMDGALPIEQNRLALVFSSLENQKLSGFFSAKNYLESLSKLNNLPRFEFRPLKQAKFDGFSQTMFDAERMAGVFLNGKCIGAVGEFLPSISAQYKLPETSAGFEIDFTAVIDEKQQPYQQLNKFPVVLRDITYEIEANISFEKLLDKLDDSFNKSGVGFRLTTKDIFSEDNKFKRITFSVELWREDKTLGSTEVNDLIEVVNSQLKTSIGAKQI